MKLNVYDDDIDLLTDLEELPGSETLTRFKKQVQANKPANHGKKKIAAPPPIQSLTNEDDHFRFTYQASRYESGWLMQSLMEFYDQQWFDDVLRLVKGGKEASVYQCTGNETTGRDYIAAKVYRPRQFRNLRKDHIYREGRDNFDNDGNVITDDGMLHAMHKRTTFGLELLHTSWIEHEVKTLQILKDAGADVPEVFASDHNAILMSYVGDDELGAPTLQEVDLEHHEAKELYDRVIWNIELMLANNRVHGDLSAYNVLYMDGNITLIDFPQAITPEQNSNAYAIFRRDVVRVSEYFSRYGMRLNPGGLAKAMWTGHQHRTAPEIDPRFLSSEDEKDRELWRKQTGR